MSTQLRKDPVNIDFYCDNEGHELYDKHPISLANSHDKPGIRDKWFERSKDYDYYFLWQIFKKHEWFPDRFMNLQRVSPPLHWLSSHYPYQELC
jgi:hypothetical protein